jgi:hypothetical protein
MMKVAASVARRKQAGDEEAGRQAMRESVTANLRAVIKLETAARASTDSR